MRHALHLSSRSSIILDTYFLVEAIVSSNKGQLSTKLVGIVKSYLLTPTTMAKRPRSPSQPPRLENYLFLAKKRRLNAAADSKTAVSAGGPTEPGLPTFSIASSSSVTVTVVDDAQVDVSSSTSPPQTEGCAPGGPCATYNFEDLFKPNNFGVVASYIDDILTTNESAYLVPEGTPIVQPNLANVYYLEGTYLTAVRRLKVKSSVKNAAALNCMQAYSARSAEEQAWKMHGGRNQFVAFLCKGMLAWEKQNPGNAFKMPVYYRSVVKSLRERLVKSKDAGISSQSQTARSSEH
ncbi:unnamed protein product [Cyclocybe aegerita]|uniref:Uncharacterized protein n=1 Tax=Cyclocybe aegerita TaxID=1973307 RepID=A0A8S0VRM7_CYCAE|nr:unnamed protein product [Cyclocybe aegerita]